MFRNFRVLKILTNFLVAGIKKEIPLTNKMTNKNWIPAKNSPTCWLLSAKCGIKFCQKTHTWRPEDSASFVTVFFFGMVKKRIRLSKVNFVTSKDLSKLESPQKSGWFSQQIIGKRPSQPLLFLVAVFWGYYVYSNHIYNDKLYQTEDPEIGLKGFSPTIHHPTIRPSDHLIRSCGGSIAVCVA